MYNPTKMNMNPRSSGSSVILPNAILIIASIYLIIVISETVETKPRDESDLRKTLYYIFLILDLCALFYINSDYYIFKKIQTNFVNFIKNLIYGKEKKKEPQDEIKNLVERSVYDEFRGQDKFRDGYNFMRDNRAVDWDSQREMKYFQPYREKELITSKSKFDERFISGKLSSPMKYQFTEYKPEYASDRNVPFKFNPFVMNNEIDLSSSNYSYRLLKSLQLSQKFYSKLKIGKEMPKDEIEMDAERIKVTDYIDNWINNLKIFFIANLIPTILDNHYENIDHLNKILEASLNIQVTGNVIDELEQQNFEQEVSYLIQDQSKINFPAKNVDNLYSSGFNLLQSSQIQGEKKPIFKIFFGDDEKLKLISKQVDYKIKSIQINQQKLKSNPMEVDESKNLIRTLFSQPGERKKISFNPVFGRNKLSKETDIIENRDLNLLENYKKLKEWISSRIMLNEMLTPYFIKEINFQHKEYVVWRLSDLEISKFENYKNDSGGNFKNEPWFSAFPTDSQLIASILIKYIEFSRETNIIKPFLVNYPLPPRIEKGSQCLILYQMNGPECEPHFNVFYEDQMINCIGGKDNFLYAMSIFLFFMKNKKSILSKQLSIDDLIDSVIKI